jgi:hypothetical protein
VIQIDQETGYDWIGGEEKVSHGSEFMSKVLADEFVYTAHAFPIRE